MPNELLLAARAALAAGQRVAARTLLIALVRADPTNGEVWHLLAGVVDDPRHQADCYARALASGFLSLPSTAETRLVAYVRSLPDFVIIERVHEPYGHMGATLTDAILQAGLNYATVVRPRVEHVLRDYPEARTTSIFLDLLATVGPANLLRWTHPEKIGRLTNVGHLFQASGVETEPQLAHWLQQPVNIASLKQVRGIGDKTTDYFKILVGGEASAVDRHLLNFLSAAGIVVRDYAEAQHTINAAADLLGIGHTRFDLSIWTYMATKRPTQTSASL